MDYIISDDGSGSTDLSAGWSWAGGSLDQHDGLGARGSLVARANRHYVMGELALAAALLMDAKAQVWTLDQVKSLVLRAAEAHGLPLTHPTEID